VPLTLVRVWRAGVTLTIVLAFIVLMGLKLSEQYLLRPLLEGLAHGLGHVWLVGGTLRRTILRVEHNVAHWLAAGALATEGPVVSLLEGCAAIIATVALVIYYLALEAYKGLRALRHVVVPKLVAVATAPLARGLHTLRATLHWLTHTVLRAALVRIRALEHDYTWLGHRVLHGLGVLRHTAAIAAHEVLGLGHRVGELARARVALWRYVRSLRRTLTVAGLTALVVAVLARLGLGWLRCRNVKQAGRSVCGMDAGLLESLLADLVILAGTLSIVELARECQHATQPLEDGLRFLLRELHSTGA
jgi:hypothetical protein